MSEVDVICCDFSEGSSYYRHPRYLTIGHLDPLGAHKSTLNPNPKNTILSGEMSRLCRGCSGTCRLCGTLGFDFSMSPFLG